MSKISKTVANVNYKIAELEKYLEGKPYNFTPPQKFSSNWFRKEDECTSWPSNSSSADCIQAGTTLHKVMTELIEKCNKNLLKKNKGNIIRGLECELAEQKKLNNGLMADLHVIKGDMKREVVLREQAEARYDSLKKSGQVSLIRTVP